MMNMVETVTGPIPVSAMGKTLAHEHFIFGYPGYQGDCTLGPFNEREALDQAIGIAREMMSFGVRTVVDPTPNECGRNPEFLRKIAEETGLQIICATGFYYEGEGATTYFKFRAALGSAEEEIYEMFKREITEGIGGTGIKPGIIKLASSLNEITDYERMFFRAAARIHKETGIILLTHTQEGTMGPEQAELLLELGADPARTIIGHMCGNGNPAYHKHVMDLGFRIGFDRFGLQGIVGAPMDEDRIKPLVSLIKEGYENQIILSHDTVNIWLGRPLPMSEQLAAMIGNWKPTHLFENIIPRLLELGVNQQQIDKMFTDNVEGLFSGYPAKVRL
jgi:phosphotriesterase-related protein